MRCYTLLFCIPLTGKKKSLAWKRYHAVTSFCSYYWNLVQITLKSESSNMPVRIEILSFWQNFSTLLLIKLHEGSYTLASKIQISHWNTATRKKLSTFVVNRRGSKTVPSMFTAARQVWTLWSQRDCDKHNAMNANYWVSIQALCISRCCLLRQLS